MTSHAGPPVRVLIVDDSAFARKVLREILQSEAGIEVVGFARDGLDALEKIEELKPDVITLDLVMPELDGLGVLAALNARGAALAASQGIAASAVLRAPRVIAVTMSDIESELGLAALEAGAFDLVHKPTAIATERLYQLGAELVSKVRAAADAPPASRRPPSASPRPLMAPEGARRTRLVVIGASTGGPQAITRVLGALPGSFPVPIAIVLHMPPGYTSAIAERLAKQTAFDVREADGGMVLEPGRIVVARSGIHLKIATGEGADNLVCRLDVQPLHSAHRPSVDELFHSAAAACGAGVLGVVLTGMGVDGLAGSRSVRAAGGRVLAESASSAVVDGMPRAVREAGLSFRDVPLEGIADAIVEAI